MKKTTIAILALFAVNSAFAADAVASSSVVTTPAPSAIPVTAPATTNVATATSTVAVSPSAPSAATTAAPTSTDTTATDDSDTSSPHLDQTISLKEGGKVLIYNSGTKVEVQNAKGEITQTSCFDACAIPLQRAVDFFNGLKQAVQKGDKQAISNMIAYPLSVHGAKVQINDANDFVNQYAQVFTPNVVKAILAQDPYTLFANDQGVMVGNGQVWFTLVIDGQQDTEGTVFITAVNA